jgi:16S rRNA (cytosine1402-N4)-methyltransferase
MERLDTTDDRRHRHCIRVGRRTMRSPSTGTVEDFFSALFYPAARGKCRWHCSLVEGLQMVHAFTHEPVMVHEVVELFAPVPPGVVVDGTAGGGGHSAAILAAHGHLGVLALDRDPDAVVAARDRLRPFGRRAAVRHAEFSRLDAALTAAAADPTGWPATSGERAGNGGQPSTAVSGVLLDLGVSSPQLERAERGFSYRHSALLDMRMDPTRGQSAADIVNGADISELASLFAANGEGRLAGRLARAIVAARPVTTTGELADIVARAVPAAVRRRGHPARRVFQALRIAVNDELGQLAAVLPAALGMLAPGGRMVVIAYHSGEDRLVKAAFAEAVAGGCTCPPGLPCVCGAQPEHQLVFRGARRPSAAEVARNHRAESARLRAVERLGAAA